MMTRMLLITLCLVAFAARAEPAPTRALIWAGGATPEAGATAMKSLEAVKDKLSALLTLAPGYPKLIESKSLAGLKPGFHVVLLGVCSADDSLLPLAVLKSLEPTVYSRAVSASEGSCPQLASEWKVSSKAVGSGMTSLVLSTPSGHWSVLTALQDGAGDVLDFNALDDSVCTGDRGSDASVSAARGVITATVSCEFAGCTTNSSKTDEYRFELRGKRIVQKMTAGKYIAGQCD